MVMAKKVHILGAGLSGMTAAINLARAGRKVLVLEGAKGIGGMGGFHPSVHTTPIDPEWMSRESGIDLTSVFHQPKELLFGVNEKTYSMGPGAMHCVERGARKTSIDSLLYDLACKAGVEFQFGTFLKDLRELPRGSIIATGLHPEMYDFLEIPFEIPRGFASTCRTDRDTWCAGVLASFTDDYFYANCVNNLMYGLLFGRKKVTVEGLEACKRDVRKRFGIDFKKWEYFTVRVPTGCARNTRLFRDGYILAGTLSGAMDPNALFGIHGAILSGKIAAEAVENPDAASKEFSRINRFYSVGYYLKEMLKYLPGRNAILQMTFTHPRAMFPIPQISSLAVPGYRQGFWYYEMMKNTKRIK